MYENALATVTSVDGNFVQEIVQYLNDKLSDSRIRQITKDDYFTYLTPEGELYDKSVVPGLVIIIFKKSFLIYYYYLLHRFFRDDSNAAMNLKRESKAYSYKEQLEEQQLRRELEEKKRKEGKIKPPQYTPKQLEAIKNQKMKEQAIRTRLTEVIFCGLVN